MSQEYKKIKHHEEKLLEMKHQGLNHKEMGDALGYKKSQMFAQ